MAEASSAPSVGRLSFSGAGPNRVRAGGTQSLMFVETARQAKRIIVAIIGFTLLCLGAVMLVTPGPGWAVIFLGLSVLAAEFVWARRLLKRLKKAGANVAGSIFGAGKGGEPKPQDAQRAAVCSPGGDKLN
jgi:putative transmembrane protein PGPGW